MSCAGTVKPIPLAFLLLGRATVRIVVDRKRFSWPAGPAASFNARCWSSGLEGSGGTALNLIADCSSARNQKSRGNDTVGGKARCRFNPELN